ncbi:hypothetical protein B0H13DRAFT_2336747 [Mycena leptocephala]|nr:hypothetical protein B0H13DRAFT_2336747 [Mycena leptocephala]
MSGPRSLSLNPGSSNLRPNPDSSNKDPLPNPGWRLTPWGKLSVTGSDQSAARVWIPRPVPLLCPALPHRALTLTLFTRLALHLVLCPALFMWHPSHADYATRLHSRLARASPPPCAPLCLASPAKPSQAPNVARTGYRDK